MQLYYFTRKRIPYEMVFCEDCAMKAFRIPIFVPFVILNFTKVKFVNSYWYLNWTYFPVHVSISFSIKRLGDTLNNVRTILKSTLDLVVWTLHQLHFEATKNTERVNILHNQNEQQRQNAMNVALHLKSSTMAAEHRIRELQQQLKDYDINAGALQEALSKKSQNVMHGESI